MTEQKAAGLAQTGKYVSLAENMETLALGDQEADHASRTNNQEKGRNGHPGARLYSSAASPVIADKTSSNASSTRDVSRTQPSPTFFDRKVIDKAIIFMGDG
jgi:hypothetical protein